MGHTAGFVSHKSVYDVTKSPDRGSFSSFALSARREEQTYMLPLPFNSSHSLPQASRAVFCLHVHSDPLVSRFQRRIDRRLWLLLVNHGFDAFASATTLIYGTPEGCPSPWADFQEISVCLPDYQEDLWVSLVVSFWNECHFPWR